MSTRLAMTLISCVALLPLTSAVAGESPGVLSPTEVNTALAAIEGAKAIANAGKGSLLMAGSALSTEDPAHGNVLTVIDYPELSKLTPGTVLLLARKDCEPIEACLVARSVIGFDSKGELQTESYGTAAPFILGQIQATLLGSVVYCIDLQTGAIRDMHSDRKYQALTLNQAIRQEKARFGQSGS